MSDMDLLYSMPAKTDSPSKSPNPPQRPPKSPAMRRKEDAAQQHEPFCPPRPPKPDRFKSPQRGCNANFSNNNDVAEASSPARMQRGTTADGGASAVSGRAKHLHDGIFQTDLESGDVIRSEGNVQDLVFNAVVLDLY